MPTAFPALCATSATDSSRRSCGSTPIAPLNVFSPHAIAVAAAAESVTSEDDEHVRVVACCDSWFIARFPRPLFTENSFAVMRCGVDMPSPMNRITLFGAAAVAAAVAATRPTTRISFFIVLCSLFS